MIPTNVFRLAVLTAGLAAASVPAHAQAPASAAASASSAQGASSPEELATLVMQTFSSGTPEAFAAVYPDSVGRVFMRSRGEKQSDLARVVWRSSGEAVLLLAGTTRSGGGVNQTNAARHFSGFYEAVDSAGMWRVRRKLPIDTTNHIRTQALSVDVVPGRGIDVVDTLAVSVGARHGFAFRINNDVKFRRILLNGVPATYEFGGGVVWIDAALAPTAELVLEYSLGAGEEPGDGGAPPAFGAFHNTDMWHPAFGYMQANHLAQIRATVRIPAEYHLTTTIPQTASVQDGVRTVTAESLHPGFLLALIYDREWEPRSTDFNTFRFESFTTPSFRHSHDTLAARTKHVFDLLTPLFGEPQFPSRYLAAVENRALGASGGFRVRMNNAAISGGGGAGLGSDRGQIFAHETAHAWTMNASGRASNFLREGWAKYAESLMLRAMHGEDAERTFWETQRTSYMAGNDRSSESGGFEGSQSILENFDNGRIHYTKGSWILRSAHWAMGEDTFNRGMRYFIDGAGKGPAGYRELIAAWSRAAGRDMSTFVMPWLTGRYVPDLEARVEGSSLIVMQEQPDEIFELPRLEIELMTDAGPILRTIDLRSRADTVSIGDIGAVSEIRIDPNARYLLQRKWGEVVRLELPAATVPDAESVQLAASFLRQGTMLPASKEGDVWVVEVPLTAGHYDIVWLPNGERGSDPSLTDVRTVRALHRIEDAYPGR